VKEVPIEEVGVKEEQVVVEVAEAVAFVGGEEKLKRKMKTKLS
jgi:hypothetical protein